LKSFKIEQIYVVSSLNKTGVIKTAITFQQK
jgi:hypothetical protein